MTKDDRGALTVREFCDRYVIGNTRAYEEIKSGRLKVHKLGRRTLIFLTDALAWEKSLPTNNAA